MPAFPKKKKLDAAVPPETGCVKESTDGLFQSFSYLPGWNLALCFVTVTEPEHMYSSGLAQAH